MSLHVLGVAIVSPSQNTTTAGVHAVVEYLTPHAEYKSRAMVSMCSVCENLALILIVGPTLVY